MFDLDEQVRRVEAARALGLDMGELATAALYSGLRIAVLAVGARRAGELAVEIAETIRRESALRTADPSREH